MGYKGKKSQNEEVSFASPLPFRACMPSLFKHAGDLYEPLAVKPLASSNKRGPDNENPTLRKEVALPGLRARSIKGSCRARRPRVHRVRVRGSRHDGVSARNIDR